MNDNVFNKIEDMYKNFKNYLINRAKSENITNKAIYFDFMYYRYLGMIISNKDKIIQLDEQFTDVTGNTDQYYLSNTLVFWAEILSIYYVEFKNNNLFDTFSKKGIQERSEKLVKNIFIDLFNSIEFMLNIGKNHSYISNSIYESSLNSETKGLWNAILLLRNSAIHNNFRYLQSKDKDGRVSSPDVLELKYENLKQLIYSTGDTFKYNDNVSLRLIKNEHVEIKGGHHCEMFLMVEALVGLTLTGWRSISKSSIDNTHKSEMDKLKEQVQLLINQNKTKDSKIEKQARQLQKMYTANAK